MKAFQIANFEVIARGVLQPGQREHHGGRQSLAVFCKSKQEDVAHGKPRQAQDSPVTTSSLMSVAGAHHAVLPRTIRSFHVEI